MSKQDDRPSIDPTMLRLEHAGLQFPGQVLRLELYRMVTYFIASERLSEMFDDGDFCPWQSLRDDFETSEIIRILLQAAVSIRFIGQGNADEHQARRGALDEKVGRLYKSAFQDDSEALSLREACNKIIHARNVVLGNSGGGRPCATFLTPCVFCFQDFTQQSGWKAEINIFPFVEVASILASSFA